MLPPWQKYPEIERYSIGWRMGYGEDYWCAFRDWIRQQDAEARRQYVEQNPEPEDWEDFYEVMLEV